MRKNLAKEIERVMDHFFATATDEEFWAALEDAGWEDFSKIEVPVIDYHLDAGRHAVQYSVVAREMSSTTGVTFSPIAESSISTAKLISTSDCVPGYAIVVGTDASFCEDQFIAANNNELALAA